MILPPSDEVTNANNARCDKPGLRSADHVSGVAAMGRMPSPLWSYLELAALPTAVSCARLHAKQILWEWGFTDLSEDGELIVSELVTNALQVTVEGKLSTPLRLWLSSNRARVLIEVWDADRTPPRLKVLDANGVPPVSEVGGRGLFLVATFSERWGWYPERALGGKVVWAEVAT
jgi:anti-sigma regulatory factor (Ser/Thr protein kinase)